MAADRLQVAVGLIQQGDCYLLGKRPAGKNHAGKWEFPGGKFEAGENLQQALARELKEELGIQVESCQPLAVHHHDYGDYSVQLELARVGRWLGQAEALEHSELGWFKLAQMASLELPSANYAIVELLQQLERANSR